MHPSIQSTSQPFGQLASQPATITRECLAHDASTVVVLVVGHNCRFGHDRDAKRRCRGYPWRSPRFAEARGANQLFASAMTTLNTHDPPGLCVAALRRAFPRSRMRPWTATCIAVDLPRAWCARSVSSFCVALFCKTSGSTRTVRSRKKTPSRG